MDTAHKISVLAHEKGLDLIAVGVPKTIDNDVGDSEFKLIDHTPGYGSVARYWAMYVQQANEENAGSCPADPVLVMQAMGRKIGFIAAAARLADPNREMPLQIYLAESKLGLEELADNVNDQLKRDGRAIVVVNEGMDIGDIGETKDAFGHTQFSASQTTVAQVRGQLPQHKRPQGCAAPRAARCPARTSATSIVLASTVDLDEAYKVGQKGGPDRGRGRQRLHGHDPAQARLDLQRQLRQGPAGAGRQLRAQSSRSPGSRPSKIDVTDDFIDYARPLIGEDWVSMPLVNGLMRFARLEPIFADKILPAYVPIGYR